MNQPNENLQSRTKAIQGKVNLLEGLHKTCQLSELGLLEPVLNEARYLSRALSDVLFHYGENQDEVNRHLATAELAVHSGINDAVDILVTFVKTTLSKLEQDYPSFNIAVSAYGDEFLNALRAIQEIDKIVVVSRQQRHDRVKIYQSLADTDKAGLLKIISDFALKLAEIEAVAQRTEKSATDPHEKNDQYLSAHMRTALRGDDPNVQFHMYLQPKYQRNVAGDICVGAEALIRLQVDNHLVPPNLFIVVAERTKIIAPLGKWVLGKASETLSKHPQIPRVSVNVSAIELLSPNYCAEVKELLTGSGVAPSKLELEITERMVMNDDQSYHHLKQLGEVGVMISIDDFGTGETRFDYLAKMPVDVIKIDMSLVRNYFAAPEAYGKLLKAIHAVGTSCGIEVIAEGVEKSDQVSGLHALGIDKFQGYYFGKGVPVSEFLDNHKDRFSN